MANKYYTHYTCSGGVNKCIKIKGCSVLPNCVGYAWGRTYEVNKEEPKLSLGNAKDWYGYKDGYHRGSVPKVGAIGCFEGGKYGHVVYVEKVYSNGDILISESNYGASGDGVRTRELKKSNDYTPYADYKLQGFIYTKKEVKPVSKLIHTFKSSNNRMYYFEYKSSDCEIVLDRLNKVAAPYKYSGYKSSDYPRYVIKFKKDVRCYRDIDFKLADATIKKDTVLFTDNINDLAKGV